MQMDKCFEFDWNYLNIHKFVKDPDERAALKIVCKKYYKYIKFGYKNFSC